jgi:hypothetical protein
LHCKGFNTQTLDGVRGERETGGGVRSIGIKSVEHPKGFDRATTMVGLNAIGIARGNNECRVGDEEGSTELKDMWANLTGGGRRRARESTTIS